MILRGLAIFKVIVISKFDFDLKEDVPRGVGSLILPNSRKLIFRTSDERQRVSPSIYMGKEYEVRDIYCITSIWYILQ